MKKTIFLSILLCGMLFSANAQLFINEILVANASVNFDRDYYEGCTIYRIVIQFIEGPMKGIETEVGLNGITFGGENSDVCVFNNPTSSLPELAKIVFVNGHYFLMNNSESAQHSFFKCITPEKSVEIWKARCLTR